jgi:transcriptional regulator with XRE-family HTH domain
MIFTQVGPNTLNDELSRYLSGTRLSLSQVALKLGVSKGHLSEIKNKKASPSLGTGLRILKECGIGVDERKAWAHFYIKTTIPEYTEVHEDWDKRNSKKLSEKVSHLLARDLDLMNAYVDIVGREDKGISLTELKLEYGRSIAGKLNRLVKEEVLSLETAEEGSILKTGTVDPIMTKNASYDLIKEVFSEQQSRYQAGEESAKFKFHINEVTAEGEQKLAELLNETMRKAEKLMGQYKRESNEEGSRVIFEVLLGSMKILIFCLLTFTSQVHFSQVWAQTSGGLSGGSSNITGLDWNQISRNIKYEVNWPEVNISGEYTGLNNLCHDQESNSLKTLEPVSVCSKKVIKYFSCEYYAGLTDCIELEADRDDAEGMEVVARRSCSQYTDTQLSVRLDHNSQILVRLNNRSFSNRSSIVRSIVSAESLTQEVEVFSFQKSSTDEVAIQSLGNKPYTIPKCQ